MTRINTSTAAATSGGLQAKWTGAPLDASQLLFGAGMVLLAVALMLPWFVIEYQVESLRGVVTEWGVSISPLGVLGDGEAFQSSGIGSSFFGEWLAFGVGLIWVLLAALGLTVYSVIYSSKKGPMGDQNSLVALLLIAALCVCSIFLGFFLQGLATQGLCSLGMIQIVKDPEAGTITRLVTTVSPGFYVFTIGLVMTAPNVRELVLAVTFSEGDAREARNRLIHPICLECEDIIVSYEGGGAEERRRCS
jgi:hypothetical protein